MKIVCNKETDENEDGNCERYWQLSADRNPCDYIPVYHKMNRIHTHSTWLYLIDLNPPLKLDSHSTAFLHN